MAGVGLPGFTPRGEERLTEEEEEALRQMMEEPASEVIGDLRTEGDPDWLVNGAKVLLHSLQGAKELNGQIGEIVGFDDEAMRYRVQLEGDGKVKKVARKNISFAPLASVPEVTLAPQVQVSSTAAAGSGQASQKANAGTLAVKAPAAVVEQVPSRDIVMKTLLTVQRNVNTLEAACSERQAAADEGRPEPDLCLSDVYLKLHTSVDVYLEVMEMYKGANVLDEELDTLSTKEFERSEEVSAFYESVRSWKEYLQDEVNLTTHSIKKHGIVGTLKNEAIGVKEDVVDSVKDAPEVIRQGSRVAVQGAQRTHVFVKQATTSVGDVVRSSSNVASRAAGGIVEDHIVKPIKRAWHLLVFALLTCFIVPLFALRAYAPMNSVIANLGLVYSLVVVMCPPNCAQSRRARGCMLFLWPFLLVALPLAVHYWLMHPGMFNFGSSDGSAPAPAKTAAKTEGASPSLPSPSWSLGKAAQFKQKSDAVSDGDSKRKSGSGAAGESFVVFRDSLRRRGIAPPPHAEAPFALRGRARRRLRQAAVQAAIDRLEA
eukprot:TRINITY_DN27311_c0_g1_i1.p1 TRINITY_DN27311_c0_g1~~TRINITY_DN27311_c0_g1_i1.p1  ORF type:complete len:543 (-),score=130.42 TRINITY_DN27311_c0_g1_i1:333-1961(-)